MKQKTLRDNITDEILKRHEISDDEKDANHRCYYKSYKLNLFCEMSEAAERAYGEGNGGETKPKISKKTGAVTPAKMASIASSSAMTFNLLGNGPAVIKENDKLPSGAYDVEFEKQMCTVNRSKTPAHLDAFLSDGNNKTAIFCEMKMLEWLGGKPNGLTEAYKQEQYYFKAENSAYPLRPAFNAFDKWRQKLEEIPFTSYDTWQMFKHTLAIYNYTSLATRESINKTKGGNSLSEKYNKIFLVNVVNEFPAHLIEDEETREQYVKALAAERNEANSFIEAARNCKIPKLFMEHCKAEFEIIYMSAEQFASMLHTTDKQRDYLKRYYS